MNKNIETIKDIAKSNISYGQQMNNKRVLSRGNELMNAAVSLDNTLKKMHDLINITEVRNKCIAKVEDAMINATARRLSPDNYLTWEDWKEAIDKYFAIR